MVLSSDVAGRHDRGGDSQLSPYGEDGEEPGLLRRYGFHEYSGEAAGRAECARRDIGLLRSADEGSGAPGTCLGFPAGRGHLYEPFTATGYPSGACVHADAGHGYGGGRCHQ